MRILLTIAAVALAVAGCTKDPKSAAIDSAREYARNAVGKPDAPIWDEMVCYQSTEDQQVGYVTGYVNGGRGAQLFSVSLRPDGKSEGAVELQPLPPTDAGERGYWIELDYLRKRDNDAACGAWATLLPFAAQIYWQQEKDGGSPSETMRKIAELHDAASKVTGR